MSKRTRRVVPDGCDPWRRFAAAVLLHAVQDAKAGDLDARRWLLFNPVAHSLADALDLDRGHVARVMLAMAGETAETAEGTTGDVAHTFRFISQ